MASEWREGRLGDFIGLHRGYDLPQQDRRPGSVPVVSSSGISDHHAAARIDGPGVVTGRYGTIGQVFYVEEPFWPLNTTLYVSDFKGNDPRFVSYLLRTIDFLAFSDKAAVPGVNRNHIHEAIIRWPASLAEQKRIAGILGSLDDKIELNRRMSQTLESMARALFKSWFVDFDPVRAKAEGRDPGLLSYIAERFPDSFDDSEVGAIPKGWRVCGLDQIADFLNGLALQRFPATGGRALPVIKIAQLHAGNIEGADEASADIPSEYVVQDGDVLFSWSGSLAVEIWCGGPGALNQHLFKVTSELYPKWFYYLWTREHLADFCAIAAGKATTMGHIQRGHLTAARVPVPPDALLDATSSIIEPLMEAYATARSNSRLLGSLRDGLLPRLITGGIAVPGLWAVCVSRPDAREAASAASPQFPTR